MPSCRRLAPRLRTPALSVICRSREGVDDEGREDEGQEIQKQIAVLRFHVGKAVSMLVEYERRSLGHCSDSK